MKKTQSPQEKLREKAQWIATKAKLPRGARIVVAVTDERGDWLGVGSNTNPVDVQAILHAAIRGAPSARKSVIEVDGVEVTER